MLSDQADSSMKLTLQYKLIKCDQACENRPSDHKKSLIFIVFALLYLNNHLYYHNKIFITTADFNGLSSAAYENGIRYSKWKILAKI